MPVIPTLGSRGKRSGRKFKAKLGYIVELCISGMEWNGIE
jgi:hypothetical protein